MFFVEYAFQVILILLHAGDVADFTAVRESVGFFAAACASVSGAAAIAMIRKSTAMMLRRKAGCTRFVRVFKCYHSFRELKQHILFTSSPVRKCHLNI